MKTPSRFFQRLAFHGLRVTLPEARWADRLIYRVHFVLRHGRLPGPPRSFNDYLFGLKCSNDFMAADRAFTSCKYFVKDFVSSRAGREHTVPTIAVLWSDEEIDAYEFPEDCCIKGVHTSGDVIIRKNGSEVDREALKKWLRKNYYSRSREINYKNVRPGVIVEPLLFGGGPVNDYKIFCVNGVPKLVQVDIDRLTNHKRAWYDVDWNKQDFSIAYPVYSKDVERPENLDDMLSLAQKVSAEWPFIRIDLYTDGEQCLVGEITHCHGGAGEVFTSPEGEDVAAQMLFGEDAFLPNSKSS